MGVDRAAGDGDHRPIVLAEQRAAAALGACNLTDQIFVRSTSDKSVTNGTSNRTEYTSRALDDDCKALALTTGHIRKGAPGTAGYDTWIEIGWQRNRQADGSVNTKCVFWEKGVDGEVTVLDGYCDEDRLEAGTFDIWRLNNDPVSGDDWDAQVNFLDGSGWHTKHTFHNDWGQGIAMGETERKGNETGMHDHQKNLEYKNNSGNWPSWPGQNCLVDTSNAYSWDQISDDEYKVRQFDHAC
jgi:hypothetical protein